MHRLESDGLWYLFDPKDTPALLVTYGESFAAQYEEYARTVTPIVIFRARALWSAICRAQQESGSPFILYQDAINSACL